MCIRDSIHYQPGLQHLTGEDVLKVARCRNNSDGPGSYPDNLYGAYPDGDIGRTRTQQQLIAAILKKALSSPQTVSYTHLDVYKRQGPPPAALLRPPPPEAAFPG